VQLTASVRYPLVLNLDPDIEPPARNYHMASFRGNTYKISQLYSRYESLRDAGNRSESRIPYMSEVGIRKKINFCAANAGPSKFHE
jgi:hypothetical protein